MSWQPTLSWQNAQKRAKILQQIRAFFAERDVLEVETPTLSQGTVTDVYIEALTCRYNFLSDSSDQNSTNLFLQTSPEFHMKRLLASGYGSIFQIAKAFRHEEAGRYHNPEFTILEWYRLGFDLFDLIKEMASLLTEILGCTEPTIDTYQNIFKANVNVDPLTATRDELLALIARYGKSSQWLSDEVDSDILLQFVFSEIIESQIGKTAPIFIYNFPKSQASLAKLCPSDTRVAQRFECYYQGIELANGFNELTDSDLQLERFQFDNHKRAGKNMEIKRIDEYFISALSSGLPQCSGVALGIDRLVMLALNSASIKEVITFPVELS